MMDWGHMATGSWVMVVLWVVGLLLLVGAIAAVVALVIPRGQASAGVSEPVLPRSAAEPELELRYARGEIDAATFVEARSVLRQR
jgi:uncharacterized membrane protein